MKRTILTILGIIVWGSSTVVAQPVQLKSFTELMDALKSGEAVKTVIHYGKCQLISGKDTLETPEAIGGMNVSTFEYFAANSIGNPQALVTFSETVLISGRKGKYMYNYVKVKAYDDDRVEIIARYLLPKNYKVKMDESFYGRLNDGQGDGPVYFYKAQ